jgi:lysozyme
MKPSTNCLTLIQSLEGEVLHPYRDQAGIATIGIGSTMYKDGTKVKITDPPITHGQAIDLLAWEVSNKCSALNGFLQNIVVNQNQYDALVSFTFNVGVGWMTRKKPGVYNSGMANKLKQNPDDPTIRDEFNKWVYITKDGKKEVCGDLVRRRKKEADLYFKTN